MWTFYTVDDAADLWAALRAKLPPRGGSGAIAALDWDYSCVAGTATPMLTEFWGWADSETCNEAGNEGLILKPDSIAADEPGRWKWVYPYGRGGPS
jgi:hypothetical protein